MAIFNLSSISAIGIVAPIPDGDIGRINQLAVGTLASNTVIQKSDIDDLLVLNGGGDAAGLHHHDSRYFTEAELTSNVFGSTGANLISASAILGGSAITIQGVLVEIENEINNLSSISMEWQKSVLDKDLVAPPLPPALGSRYLVGLIPLSGVASGAWAGHDAEIAQWNGSSWEFTAPETGMFVTADDEILPAGVYFFNGTVWVATAFENTTASGFLSLVGNDVRLTELNGGNIIIGDFADTAVAIDTAVVGHIQADPVGGLIIKPDVITDSHINSNAGISFNKMQPGNPADIIVCDALGIPTLVGATGDVTISSSGVTTIGVDVVDDTMIDFGTGAGQVNAADLPAGYTATNYTPANANVDGHLSGIDSEINTINTDKVSRSGDTMFGNLTMSNDLGVTRFKITELEDGSAANDAVNKGQLDALESSVAGDVSGKVSKTGDTMTGNLIMSSNKITSLANGTISGDAVNFGQLSTKLDAALKGVPNGVAELDGSGLVPASQLPSFVDDVLEYADFASLPVAGETGKIYVTLDNNKTFRWSGTIYIEISPNDVNSVNGQTGIVVIDTDDITEGVTNLYYTQARFDTAFGNKDTDDLAEGAANFYYTEGRFDISFGGKDTDDLTEGAVNLYYTGARFDADLATKTTTNLAEGLNLYFTDQRAKDAAVIDSTAGNETDQAASVGAMKTYVQNEISSATPVLIGGNGIDVTGSTISMDVDSGVFQFNAGVLDVAPNGIDGSHIRLATDQWLRSSEGNILRSTDVGFGNHNVVLNNPSTGSLLLQAQGATTFAISNGGFISAMNNRIRLVATPVDGTDAANRNYVDTAISAIGPGVTFGRDVIVLTPTDILNGYVDLSHEIIPNSEIVYPAGGLIQVITDDYTLAVPGSVTRVTFVGTLATDLVSGDKLIVQYAY